MSSRFAALAVVIFLAVSVAGSSSSAAKSGSAAPKPLTPPAGFDHLSVSDTARALVDPSRVRLGVWSLLDHLGIGVYTSDGKQVLAGSERSEEDFWLYDFEIPVLVRMATASSIPFSEYADYLHAHGVTATVDEVLAGYASAYAKHADAFLVQLFAASKVQFSGAPSISPLSEWLLLLDATVSPNGRPAQGSSLGRASGVTPVALVDHCSLGGDGRASGFGIARSESQAIAIAFGEAVADLPSQAMLIANAIDVSVLSHPNEVHEGHNGPGARESIDATAQIGDFPFTVRCGTVFPQLVGNLASLRGPLAGVTLTWSTSPEVSGHGTLTVGGAAGNEASNTDRSGRSHVSFDTREEPSKGKGDLHDLTANVFVRADVRLALLTSGASQLLVDLLPSQVPVRGMATFRISWHDDSDQWTGTLHATRSYADSQSTLNLTWEGTASLTVDTHGKVSGTFDVTGTVTSITEFGTFTLPDAASWKLSGERKGHGFVISKVSPERGSYFDEVIPSTPFTIPVAGPGRISTALTPILPDSTLQIELTCPTCKK